MGHMDVVPTETARTDEAKKMEARAKTIRARLEESYVRHISKGRD